MVAPYANSYIDRLYAEKDIFTLHGVIRVIRRHRDLPEQFSVFSRLLEWWSSSRSGIWQYYEQISADEFESLARALERLGLGELAQRYRSGMATWKEPDYCRELDRWIEDHDRELEGAAFRLIADRRDCLYDES